MNSATQIFATPEKLELSSLPKVGDILVGAAGYEASIATFAIVVGVGKATVKVQELDQTCNYKQGGMEWTAVPNLAGPRGDVLTKRIKPLGGTYKIKWCDYMHLSPWRGNVVSCYNYH